MHRRRSRFASHRLPLLLAGALLLGAALPALAAPRALAPEDHAAVVGLREAYLQASHWISQMENPDAVILDRAAIAAQNARMLELDPSVHDLRKVPTTLKADWVRKQVEGLASAPSRTLYGEDSQPVAAELIAAALANRNLDGIARSAPARHGLVVHRADLRAFPTTLRVFNSAGDTDIDRWQESGMFPGDAVVVLHESSDGQWYFVASERYYAWVESKHIAIGDADTVFGYREASNYRVVTGATARTVHTPEEPRVSNLQLDMGVKVPVLSDWPMAQTVNGQQGHAHWVIQLPVRNDDGSLSLVPALLPRSADTAADYLPLTGRHLMTQAFKFLGERYGWGHSYDARDCSGFVSEIYRSFGIVLPRNTSSQGISPALDRIAFDKDSTAEQRQRAVDGLQPGDLVYIPGHVMMTIGKVDGLTWMIHDTNGGSFLGTDGKRVAAQLNGVSVTPLEPMLFGEDTTYVDRMTNIQRIRKTSDK
jgi:cell wall-associated NlpC family hydrolase